MTIDQFLIRLQKKKEQREYMEGRKSGSWCFLTGKPMEKAILEMSVRAMESIHLLLAGTACKSEVKSMKLKKMSGGHFSGLPHLFTD